TVKIIAVTNIKGGVGKTTTAVNLAYLCAAGGWTTLLWDLDSQGGATYAVHLAARRHPTGRLLKMSRPLRELYAALFLDCPSGISLLSENVLRAADVVIVPLVPTPLSVRMFMQLRDFVVSEGWSDLKLLPFFSMVDRRRALHPELIANARQQFPTMLATEVPYSSEIERMSVRRAPLPAYAPKSEPARIYGALWAEIREHLEAAARVAPAEAS